MKKVDIRVVVFILSCVTTNKITHIFLMKTEEHCMLAELDSYAKVYANKESFKLINSKM